MTMKLSTDRSSKTKSSPGTLPSSTATDGREGLFHLTLAAALRFVGYNPLGWRLAGFGAWGLIGLAAIYALSKRLLDQRAALITLAFAATSFWSIYEGRAATRSVSLIAVSALAALAFFRAWQQPDRSRRRRWVIAGALTGLMLYTYIAARVMPLVFVALLVYLAAAEWPAWRAAWRSISVYVVTAGAGRCAAGCLSCAACHGRHALSGIDWDDRGSTARQPHASAHDNAANAGHVRVGEGDPQWHYNVAHTPVFDPLTSGSVCAGTCRCAVALAARVLCFLSHLADR